MTAEHDKDGNRPLGRMVSRRMSKRKMAMLGKAFASEVAGALTKSPSLMQTKSKLADELVSEGLLENAQEQFGGILGVTLSGYRLTHAGRLLYCASCDA